MFGNNIDKIKLDSLLTQMTDMNRQMGDFWKHLRETQDKVNKLYNADKHGTLRPRVDMLSDDVYKNIIRTEDGIFDLQEKVEVLEKAKENK